MKVALYGNICNNFYTLAKCLRSHDIANAHLYLNPRADMQNLPESDDPALTNNYPDWIHLDNRWDAFHFLKKRDKTFIDELNKYDVVFLSELGVSLAPYLKGKTLFYATGSDLTTTPFPKNHTAGYKTLKSRLVWEYIGLLQRRGIRASDVIITQPFFPFANALKKLRVRSKKISKAYYPFLIDTTVIKKTSNPEQEIDSANLAALQRFNFTIFHPSRLVIRKSRKLVETGHWKGNDNLFKAFAIFLSKYHVTDACIAMPDRVYSTDASLAREIIQQLDIQKNVVWLTSPTPEGFPRQKLLSFYSFADIVADEFATGWFGLVVLEGLACGKPTLCYVDEQVMEQLYPWHPILSAKEPEAIADLIAKIYFDKMAAETIGKQSRIWIDTFHSFENGIKRYIDNLRNDLMLTDDSLD